MRFVQLKHLLFIFFSLISLQTYSAPPQKALLELNLLLNNFRTLQANFTQLTLDDKKQVIQRAQGQAAIARPGRLRWENTSPDKRVIIANHAYLWIFEPDLEQVTIKRLAKQNPETPALLLSDTQKTLGQNFYVKKITPSSSLKWFLLSPKQGGGLFAWIKLGFKGNVLQSMELQDQLGYQTVIQFENIRQNSSIASHLFIFKAPPHTDIIDETET